MENVVEALKIAFAVMMFCLALTLSISSFTETRLAADLIIEMRDRENEYTYVKPSEKLARTVGLETIVPTMYRALKENIGVYFFDASGNPLALYCEKDEYGNIIKEINYIDCELEMLDSSQLDLLLEKGEYKNQICQSEGLYKFLSKYDAFEERVGEYYQSTGASKVKKRVIAYIIQ